MIQERIDFTIGEEASLSKAFNAEDVLTFARISNDQNPVHVDGAYASTTIFKAPIVHGMLVSGLISAVLGTQLPGPGSIYLTQNLRFCAPVFFGDTITARVKVVEWDGVKGRITMQTEALNQNGQVVITGEAKLAMSSFLKKS
jgi:3-hydroxybutyryl-CoA dehydratase